MTGFVVSALWIIVSMYVAFFDVDPDQYGFKSPEVDAGMESCGGSFKQRYHCKESLILTKHRQSFVLWIEKVAIILGPPLLLGFLIRRISPHVSANDDDMYPTPPLPLKKRRSTVAK
jgi:hypothetical protein